MPVEAGGAGAVPVFCFFAGLPAAALGLWWLPWLPEPPPSFCTTPRFYSTRVQSLRNIGCVCYRLVTWFLDLEQYPHIAKNKKVTLLSAST